MSTSIVESLKVQKRVVSALLMREIITRYGRHNVGFLWLFFEPMMFTLGVTAVWTLMGLSRHGIPVVAFAITGYCCVLLWRNTANRTVKAIEPNLSLMYHRNVKVLDIFLARILLEIVGATVAIVTLTCFFSFIGWMEWPDDIVFAVLGWLFLAWFAMALGLIFGSLSERSETFERIWHVVQYLMFPFSGAVYMVDWLPEKAQKAALWLPMVNCTEMVRHGYFGRSVTTHENVLYIVIINSILMLIGMFLTKDASYRVQPE